MTEIEKELKKRRKLLLEAIIHSLDIISLLSVAKEIGLQVKVSNEMEPELKGLIKQLPDGSVVICCNGKDQIGGYQQKYVIVKGLLAYVISDRDIKEGVLFY